MADPDSAIKVLRVADRRITSADENVQWVPSTAPPGDILMVVEVPPGIGSGIRVEFTRLLVDIAIVVK